MILVYVYCRECHLGTPLSPLSVLGLSSEAGNARRFPQELFSFSVIDCRREGEHDATGLYHDLVDARVGQSCQVGNGDDDSQAISIFRNAFEIVVSDKLVPLVSTDEAIGTQACVDSGRNVVSRLTLSVSRHHHLLSEGVSGKGYLSHLVGENRQS